VPPIHIIDRFINHQHHSSHQLFSILILTPSINRVKPRGSCWLLLEPLVELLVSLVVSLSPKKDRFLDGKSIVHWEKILVTVLTCRSGDKDANNSYIVDTWTLFPLHMSSCRQCKPTTCFFSPSSSSSIRFLIEDGFFLPLSSLPLSDQFFLFSL